jgi:high-affinity iron transporter
LSQESLVGQTLHVLIGYQDRPSGIGLLAYALTLVAVGSLMAVTRRGRRPPQNIPASTRIA